MPTLVLTRNNFQKLPIDSVMERSAQTVTRGRSRVIKKYGLYHDPISARLLLLKHQALVRKGEARYTQLRPYMSTLADLNWLSRRLALYCSLEGTVIGAKLFGYERDIKNSRVRPTSHNRNRRTVKGARDPAKKSAHERENARYEYVKDGVGVRIASHNILARIRYDTGLDVLKNVFVYI